VAQCLGVTHQPTIKIWSAERLEGASRGAGLGCPGFPSPGVGSLSGLFS
jgi:hypothetical protein